MHEHRRQECEPDRNRSGSEPWNENFNLLPLHGDGPSVSIRNFIATRNNFGRHLNVGQREVIIFSHTLKNNKHKYVGKDQENGGIREPFSI